MTFRVYTILFIILLPNVLLLVLASSGDRSREFRDCLSHCSHTNCSTPEREARFLASWSLHALSWSCWENCQYECMHIVTSKDVLQGKRVRQFHGKWPFVRVLGVQEPASTVFSVLNAASLLIGYVWFLRRAPIEYPYHPLLWLQFWVSMHAWFWSAVFHSRDLYWTERLDYFSAASLIVTAIIVQFVRVTGPSAMKWHIPYAVLWVLLYSAHVCYLALWKFDYAYNMAASVVAGVVHTSVWLLWCWKHRQRGYVWKCAAVWLATTCFLSLELLDFPPLLWTFDAHSLWHLSTVPMPFLWFSFLLDDAHHEVTASKRKVV